ncbi:barstar family protein [Streptomyces sp. NPDC005951]|uniref:barstar family protein n=1 Tax=Streptomyces sp. NPDC005951 TaxID=3154573 RepID=UPI0033E54C2B
MDVEIDGKRIRTPLDFHEALAEALDFGPYYRPNLAALWDRLSADVERPVTIVWRNSEESRAAMGSDKFEELRSVLIRTQEQDLSFGWDERFNVRFA